MKRSVLVFLIFLLASPVYGEVFKNVQYIGGFPDLQKEKAKGELEVSNDKVTFWEGGKNKNKELFSFPTNAVSDVGIGLRARRRVISAVLWTPWLLFAKKKNDVVLIEFKDEIKKTAGAPSFIVKKDSGVGIKAVVEVKTGKTFADELMYNEDIKDRKGEKGQPSSESKPTK